CPGAVEGDLELPGIEAVQNLASLDVLILGDVDLLDDARNVSRDADLVGFDIRVIRRHHSTAGDVPIAAGDQRQRQQREQRPARPAPVPMLGRLFGLRGFLDWPFRLLSWRLIRLLSWKLRRQLARGVAPRGRRLGHVRTYRNYGRVGGHGPSFGA